MIHQNKYIEKLILSGIEYQEAINIYKRVKDHTFVDTIIIFICANHKLSNTLKATTRETEKFSKLLNNIKNDRSKEKSRRASRGI
jgi:hypothetical protein